MRNKKILATVTLVSISVGMILAIRALKPDPAELLKTRNAERSQGSEKAPIWITEYFDYQCPPCATARTILEKAMTEHPGQIYLQARFFPLPAHKNGTRAALFAECASHQKGKFWKFHEEMLKRQDEWAKDDYAIFKFTSYAESIGMNLKQLDACVHDPKTEADVAEEKKKAVAIGVQMTPTFYVNGKMVVGAKALLEEIKAVLDKKEAS